MSSAPDLRQVRAALLLSVGLGFVGFSGVFLGLGQIDLATEAAPVAEPPQGTPDEQGMQTFADAQREVLRTSPYLGWLGSMNVVVSAMLMIGSFMLSARSKNATWWVRNAAAANGLHVLLDSAMQLEHLFRLRPALVNAMAASPRPMGGSPTAVLTVAATVVVVVAVLRLGIQAWLYRRIGSEPVQGFLATAAD